METKLAIEDILGKLNNGLKSHITYHSFEHTLDVIKQVKRIAKSEGIIDKHKLDILLTAAAFHDCGFLHVYFNHEEEGCKIAANILPKYNYKLKDIAAINKLIMATKVPQKPRGIMQKIICDADLDYLGRNDFFEIGATLYEEFKEMKIVKDFNAWNELQLKFIGNHKYFTVTNQKLRENKKQINLNKIRKVTKQ